MQTMTGNMFVAALKRMVAVFQDQMDALSRMDAAIGDGDHGISMARGFQAVGAKLPDVQERGIGAIARMVGDSLTGGIGGVTGPVFGTIFTQLALQAQGRNELGVADLARALRGALEAIQTIGQAQVGDKTMVDALAPAVAALERAADEGRDLDDALAAAAQAAEGGARATAAMRATRGRARYLGERSVGHQDPGATSFALIMKALLEGCRATPTG
jgi:dihydroxyacetone kinase-like protein